MEDSQQTTTPIMDENEKLIQEMLRVVDKVDLPSELTREPILHKGDEVLPAPMVVQHISSAGYVNIWETRTHEPAICLYYMLPSRLRQRRPDGSYRWTVIDPKIAPKRGTYKCMLHAESPDREHYNALGFRVCKKSNLTNPYQVRQHMIKKHKQEWLAIEQERLDRERLEDRAVQKAILLQMGKSGPTPEPVMAEEPDIGIPWLEEPTPISMDENEYFCPECNRRHRKTSKLGKRHLKHLK